MSPGRIVAVIAGVVVGLIALGLLAAGTFLTIGYAVTTEDDGYFDTSPRRFGTETVAVATEEADLAADPAPPAELWDFIDFSLRFRVDGLGDAVFLGIADEADVSAYLQTVAYEEVRDVRPGDPIRYRAFTGGDEIEPPTEQGFWVASTSGVGLQELVWDVTGGTWVVVLMNAAGSPGVYADVAVGAKSAIVLPIGIAMLAFGLFLFVVALVIILLAALVGRGGVPGDPALEPAPFVGPVRLEASLDEPLSQWMWLVKWFLAIPHFFVLAFLWLAFVVLTFISWWAILFTGRYPESLFAFNVGVMRWTWRVMYYAGPGGLGTDRYPPFTTEPVDDYPARLDIAYPERLSRGLIFVKWLLAIPHLIVVALFFSGVVMWGSNDWWGVPVWSGGLLGILILVAAVVLLFTGRYPRPLFDLIVGLNRWAMRVAAYVNLMSDEYPPFRLDQGGSEPEPADDAMTT